MRWPFFQSATSLADGANVVAWDDCWFLPWLVRKVFHFLPENKVCFQDSICLNWLSSPSLPPPKAGIIAAVGIQELCATGHSSGKQFHPYSKTHGCLTYYLNELLSVVQISKSQVYSSTRKAKVKASANWSNIISAVFTQFLNLGTIFHRNSRLHRKKLPTISNHIP